MISRIQLLLVEMSILDIKNEQC